MYMFISVRSCFSIALKVSIDKRLLKKKGIHAVVDADHVMCVGSGSLLLRYCMGHPTKIVQSDFM